jgi:PKD repeat protein
MKKIYSVLFLFLSLSFTAFGQKAGYCDSITADVAFQTSGTTVYFAVKSSVKPVSAEWSFGDGTSSKDVNVTHAYGKYGTYQPCVKLTFRNIRDTSKPCVKTICKSVTLSDPCSSFNPTATFKVDSTGVATYEAAAPNTKGVRYYYLWDFGDNTTGDGRTGKHTYKAGTYKACVLIKDSATKCVKQLCFNFTVAGSNPCNSFNPNAGIKADSTGLATYEAQFDSFFTYKWDFGDSTTSTTRTGKHQYKAGSYKACVTITNTKTKCTKTLCYSVSYSGSNSNPCNNYNPKFDYKIDSTGKATFFGASTNPSTTSYSWSYGDGTSGTGSPASHTYKAGTYKFCVTMTDNTTKCTKTICETITYGNDPCKGFNPTFGYKIDGTTVMFEGQFDSNFTYNWWFSNNATSTDRSLKIDFKNPGTYRACVLITNKKTGCKLTVCKDFVIQGKNTSDPCKDFKPKVGFQLDDPYVNFTADGGKGATFEWNFGDGSKSTDRSPRHKYAKSGKYNICVTVYDAKRKCKKTICFSIEVTVPNSDPCANFKPDFSFTTNGTKVIFEGNTKGLVYSWNFGDKKTGTGKVADHAYAGYGSYTVCMTAYDSVNKCKKTVCKTIILKQKMMGAADDIDAISLYPNPVDNTLSIVTTSESSAQITIRDSKGTDIMRYDATPDENMTIQMMVDSLPKGLYYISIEQNGKVDTSKFYK